MDVLVRQKPFSWQEQHLNTTQTAWILPRPTPDKLIECVNTIQRWPLLCFAGREGAVTWGVRACFEAAGAAARASLL